LVSSGAILVDLEGGEVGETFEVESGDVTPDSAGIVGSASAPRTIVAVLVKLQTIALEIANTRIFMQTPV
jgi:hypothetical protein